MKLPGFVVRMSQKFQRPPKVESISRKDSNKEEELEKKELKLWRENQAWLNNYPDGGLKVKKEKNSIYHAKIEVRIGLPPEQVFDLFANQKNRVLSRSVTQKLHLLNNKSRKVLKDEGDEREIVKLEKSVGWKFLGFSGAFPFTLIADEDRKNLTAKYKKEKMMFMEIFEGSWKVEPLLIDERMCEPFKPKTRQEYRKCSKGLGRTASKLTFEQYFKPTLLLNVPPFSSYIRKITTNTTETVFFDLLGFVTAIREDSINLDLQYPRVETN